MIHVTLVEYESAYATLCVYHDKKEVFIEDLKSGDTGLGHGSGLLDKIKTEYSDYKIYGNMQPLYFTKAEKPSEDEIERAYDLGWDPKTGKIVDVGFPLTEDQKAFIEDVNRRL